MNFRNPWWVLVLLAAVSFAAMPAAADIYNNGPINGNTDAWTINFGYAVSDTFFTASPTEVVGYVVWRVAVPRGCSDQR